MACAVRAVNARFDGLAPSVQSSIEIRFDGLDGEVDAAILAGDRDRALAAIRAWKQHWLREFERAGS